MTINYYGLDVNFNATNEDLIIYDSYSIRHAHYSNILWRIKEATPDCPIWEKRSKWSIECEWAVHNLLYKLGIKREHTKDVNLNYNLKWYEKIAYVGLGSLIFIWK